MPRGNARSRRDDNHAEIVAYARSLGFSVREVHMVAGALDLIVGIGGVDGRIEIKDGAKPPSRRRLTPAEREEFETWRGRLPVVWETPEDVYITRRAMLGLGKQR